MLEASAIEPQLFHLQGGFALGKGKAFYIPALVCFKLVELRAITNQYLWYQSAEGRYCSSCLAAGT